MTLREMFKKIETYNEVAEIVGTEQLRIHITFDYFSERFNDYKSFMKYARRELADDLINAVTSCKEFAFGEAYTMRYSCYGLDTSVKIEINAYEN